MVRTLKSNILCRLDCSGKSNQQKLKTIKEIQKYFKLGLKGVILCNENESGRD
jgi:hypothetical protein